MSTKTFGFLASEKIPPDACIIRLSSVPVKISDHSVNIFEKFFENLPKRRRQPSYIEQKGKQTNIQRRMNEMKDFTKEKRERLKALMRGYRHMTNSLKKGLKRLGFEVETGRTHHKLYYGGDRSHSFTLSVSASDARTGINMAHQLAKALPCS